MTNSQLAVVKKMMEALELVTDVCLAPGMKDPFHKRGNGDWSWLYRSQEALEAAQAEFPDA